MRRTYSRERYLALVERLRDAIPDLALGTDIIVGFPGETEDDFRETLEVVQAVGFDSAFTFVYSPRAGTEGAAMAAQVPEDVKRERMERLVEVVQLLPRDGTPIGSDGWRRCSSRGRAAPIRHCSVAGRGGTRPSTSPVPPRRETSWGRDRERHLHHAEGPRDVARRRLTVDACLWNDRHEAVTDTCAFPR